MTENRAEHVVTILTALLKHAAQEMRETHAAFSLKRTEARHYIAAMEPLLRQDSSERKEVLDLAGVPMRLFRDTEKDALYIGDANESLLKCADELRASGQLSRSRRSDIAAKIDLVIQGLIDHFINGESC